MRAEYLQLLLFATIAGAVIVFRVVPWYQRSRKLAAETAHVERIQSEERARKAEDERQLLERKRVLRARDSEVDPVLRALLLAKVDLERVLNGLNECDLSPDDLARLHQWTERHVSVMDFPAFEAIREYFPQPNDPHPFLLKEEVQGLLAEHCDAVNCLAYADERLGIERGFYLWDGDGCGGVRCELGNGKYEDPNLRFQRILLKLPGTDRGYVYVLSNPSLPGLVKIGMTRRHPDSRVTELSDLSGVPTPFVVAYEVIVGNCTLVERLAHQRLAKFRVNDAREFFSTGVQKAKETIEAIAREVEG